MPKHYSFFAYWRHDLPASLVVFLVALPLCLGIALASGAPLFSGLISGVVGGIVVGALSKSPLSVAGPAAGLTVIVLAAIQQLPSFEAFLLAVCLAGVLQVMLGIARAGVIGDFIPSAVITGMLTAIGLIIIMKQLPHGLGYGGNFFGDEAFSQFDGENTFTALMALGSRILPGALLITVVSLAFMFWWDNRQKKLSGFWRYLPGPLVVVLFGVAANAVFMQFLPEWSLKASHLVAVPVANSFDEFLGQFRFPDTSLITDPAVWTIAVTLALVASVESLLSVEAVDKLDPYRRVSPTNRELMAQGAGNIASGLIGGLPVTAVIVRSSANVTAGARTRLSAVAHGFWLLGSVVFIPVALNSIPLAALAAVLIGVGYKLAKPSIFVSHYRKGMSQFVPFIVTVSAILLTDLLMGVFIGVLVGAAFILVQNSFGAIVCVNDEKQYRIRFKKDLFFLHKYELKKTLSRLPNDSHVQLDFTQLHFVDKDNIEIVNDFLLGAPHRGITVEIRKNDDMDETLQLKLPDNVAA